MIAAIADDRDAKILEEFVEAFRRYSRDGVIDIDNKLKIKFNFQIHHLADVVAAYHGMVPPYRQSQYYIVVVQTGTGEKSIGQFTFKIVPKTLFVIPERTIHSTKQWSTDSTGYVLSFNLDFFMQNEFPKRHIVNRRIFKCSIRPYIRLDDAQMDKVLPIFETIFNEHQLMLPDREEFIAIKILELLMLCDRLFAHVQNLKIAQIYCPWVNKFTNLIEKNFKTHRDVGFYAKAMHVHPNYLNARVKTHTGFTAKETIVNYIVLEAKSLLASTQLSTKEIAFELGFEHPEHFYSLFKNAAKMTPAQYRQMIH